ncbi:hypothetical protein H5410_045851, partial [Solanum commersonii]
AINLVVLVLRPPSRASRKHMDGFVFATTNPLNKTITTRLQKITLADLLVKLVDAAELLGDSPFFLLLFGTIRRSADYSFYRLFYPLPSGLCILEQRVESVLSANRQCFLAMLMLQLFRSFHPFCSFLHLRVHASTKTSNT